MLTRSLRDALLKKSLMRRRRRGLIMFKPTFWKFLIPVLLVALALLPLQVVHMFVFETLAYPFGSLLDPLRYIDKPYLNALGVLVVACVWAAVSYLVASIAARAWSTTKGALDE